MAVTTPQYMRDSAWQYLLKFTEYHEAAVLHLYNNRDSPAKAQDVTCGIGFRLETRASSCQQWVKDMFIGGSSDGEMMADWDAAAAILRTGTSVAEYAAACKQRMDRDRVLNQMAVRLKGVVDDLNRRGAYNNDFLMFDEWPAQAQVALVSYAYGYSPAKAPLMSAALASWNFKEAARQCRLKNGSERKNKAHQALFQNAAVIAEKPLNNDLVPTGYESITLL